MNKVKTFTFFLLAAVLLLFTVETAAALSEARVLSSEVLRLHVIAASDSEYDQELKLKVRDAVLEETEMLFENSDSAESAAETARDNLGAIRAAAEKSLAENRCDFGVTVSVGESYFPTKCYDDDVALPAGVYNAVKIEIGEANGQNWWCVLFPRLCLSASLDRESIADETLSAPSRELSSRKSGRAKIRFKLIEEINRLFCGK